MTPSRKAIASASSRHMRRPQGPPRRHAPRRLDTLGAVGGLTCYFMPELTRDALFDALRSADGTTGRPVPRIFRRPARGVRRSSVTGFTGGSAARGPATAVCRCERPAWATSSGRAAVPMRLSVEAIGTAPVDRLDVLHGTQVVRTVRTLSRLPTSAAACACSGRAPSIAGAGARPCGRENSRLGGNRIRALRAGELPQSGAHRARRPAPGYGRSTSGARSRPATWPASISGSNRPGSGALKRRNQCCVGRGGLEPVGGRSNDFRRRWSRPKDQHLSAAGKRLESARYARPHGRVLRPSRPSSLRSCDTGRRQSGVVKPNLPCGLAGRP